MSHTCNTILYADHHTLNIYKHTRKNRHLHHLTQTASILSFGVHLAAIRSRLDTKVQTSVFLTIWSFIYYNSSFDHMHKSDKRGVYLQMASLLFNHLWYALKRQQAGSSTFPIRLSRRSWLAYLIGGLSIPDFLLTADCKKVKATDFYLKGSTNMAK